MTLLIISLLFIYTFVEQIKMSFKEDYIKAGFLHRIKSVCFCGWGKRTYLNYDTVQRH